MRHSDLPIAAVLILICIGCGGSDDVPAREMKMVYVDTETLTAVVAPKSATVPAINSATGQRTLMPGLYCPTCEKWYPAPDVEQINRLPGAALCPKTGTPMIADGPWPNDAESQTMAHE